MREFVLVEFFVKLEELDKLTTLLDEIGDDFNPLDNVELEFDNDNTMGTRKEWVRFSGKINSTTATLIKLQNPFLAEAMRISHIPDELKDKYRNKS